MTVKKWCLDIQNWIRYLQGQWVTSYRNEEFDSDDKIIGALNLLNSMLWNKKMEPRVRAESFVMYEKLEKQIAIMKEHNGHVNKEELWSIWNSIQIEE